MPPAPDDVLFAWAHLSDLHVGQGGASDAARRRMVLTALAACARVTGEDMVTRIAGATAPAVEGAPGSTGSPWMAGIAGMGEAEIGDWLADLAERSLVECVDAERGLWTLHDVVRFFVRAQEGMRKADEAHLAWAWKHVDAHRDPLDWRAMEAGMGEVLAAVERLLGAGGAPQAWKLLRRAEAHLRHRGRYGELVEHCAQIAPHLPDGSKDLARALGCLGRCYMALGDIPMAIEHHQRSLALCESLGWLRGQATRLDNLGLCYAHAGEFRTAIAHHQRALALSEKLGRLEGQAAQLGNLGICYQGQGDIPKAIEHHQRALALNEELGRLEGQAAQLGNLGRCYQAQGDLLRAMDHHQRALMLSEELGRPEGQAAQLCNLGLCLERQDDIPRALAHFQRALALYERIGLHYRDVRATLDALARLQSTPSR